MFLKCENHALHLHVNLQKITDKPSVQTSNSEWFSSEGTILILRNCYFCQLHPQKNKNMMCSTLPLLREPISGVPHHNAVSQKAMATAYKQHLKAPSYECASGYPCIYSKFSYTIYHYFLQLQFFCDHSILNSVFFYLNTMY